MDRLTPFASKVKEISRNISIISQRIGDCAALTVMLRNFSQDLAILSMEVDLTTEERLAVERLVSECDEQLVRLSAYLKGAQDSAFEASEALRGDNGLGPYMSREVVNPFTPIFGGKMAEHKDRLPGGLLTEDAEYYVKLEKMEKQSAIARRVARRFAYGSNRGGWL